MRDAIRRTAGALLVLAGLALALALALAPAPALARNRNVLVLDTGVPGRPLAAALMGAFRETLAGTPDDPISIYEEALDLERFSDEAHAARLRAFLAAKYRDHPPHVIVALGDPAVRLVLPWRDQPWADPPVAFAVADEAVARAARETGRATGVVVRFDVEGGLRAALALRPDTEEVVLVAGGDPFLPLAERALQALGGRVRVTRLVDVSLAETRRRLAELPPRSFVYYTQINRDRDGRGFFGRSALEELAPVSRRPIFSHFGTYLGRGITGGSMVEADVVGREMADVAGRVLAGTPPSAIPVVASRSNRLLFDWRELRRFGLDENRLPPGSEVRFRRPSLFEEYRATVVTVTVLLAVQSGLIVALFMAVQRRRAAQRQLRQLSGRILTAQEEERSRIARELHDGVSQQMALFAIELDQLGAQPDRGAGEAPGRARALAERARDLSRELHHIAHELHPAILDQLGLVPALRQFANQLSARQGLKVEVVESEWPPDLPADVSLALYRVAQEALQNVSKHSGATAARVALRGSPSGVTLMVSDPGRGFDPGAGAETARLGLAGMKERLRLVGGELCLDSAPGGGTVIAAGVPRRALAGAEAAPEASA